MTLHLKNPPDSDAAIAMVTLVERGRAALSQHIVSLPLEEQPLGGARAVPQDFPVVTYADFIAHTAVCFRHVVKNGVCLHVLCEDGAICAVFDKRVSRWSASSK